MPKHEIIACPSCGAQFECKLGSFSICDCSDIHLTREQSAYLSEQWDGCLCCQCLRELKENWPVITQTWRYSSD